MADGKEPISHETDTTTMTLEKPAALMALGMTEVVCLLMEDW